MSISLKASWQRFKLRDVCQEITVGYVGPMADEYVEDGITFLRSQNILPFHLDLSSVKYIDAVFHKKLKKSALHPGDIAVVRTGYPGTACVIPSTLPIANCADLVIIRTLPHVDPYYLTNVFNSAWGRDTIAGRLVGVAQQHFNVGAAKEMFIDLPPLPIQHQIASILSAYDDLIENNVRRIAILEETARMLYHEWFVNFRFPGHEQVQMVESELGMIPEGWEVATFTQAIEVDPYTKILKDNEKPFVPMDSLSNNSMIIEHVTSRGGNSGSKFKNGDTLFARITPCIENGKTGYVQFLAPDEVAFGSTEFIVLRSKTLCSEFVYLIARSNELRDHAIKSMSGATGRQRVQKMCFDNFLIAHPDAQTLMKFETIVKSIFRNIYLLSQKNANLRRTRDLLLPKLISGEIDVSGWVEGDVEMEAEVVGAGAGATRIVREVGGFVVPVDVSALEQRSLWG